MFLWHGYVIWVGEGLDIGPHEHVAHQLSVGLDGPFEHQTRAGEVIHGHGFVCPSGVAHGFRSATSRRQLIFWVEPHTWEGRRVSERFQHDEITVLSKSEVDELREALSTFDLMTGGADDALRARNALFRTMFGRKPDAHPIDDRVARAIDFYLQNRARDVTVGEAARHVALSEAHFSRLFAKTIGVPPTRYRLWMRMLEAVRLVLGGDSITDAAYGAGFADAAHFTRTYNRMVGSGGPRASIENMEVVICDERWSTSPAD